MTKTVEIPHRPREIKVETKSRESSQSPPLVLKYLEALPAEKELTFLVEVVDKPSSPKGSQLFKVPKIIAENPGKNNSNIASVVKDEIPEFDPLFEEDFDEIEDDEEEDCLRIIEEKIIDVSTLPGKQCQ